MSTHHLALSPRTLALCAVALVLILAILASAPTSASSTAERPVSLATPGAPAQGLLQSPTPTCSFNTIFTGVITNTDPLIPNPLVADGSPSSCAAPNACPGAGPASTRHYDTFSRLNSTGSEICYQVQVNASNCPGNLFVAAYSGQTFDPNNVCLNYLADIGVAPFATGEFGMRVPAGAWFTLVAYETAPDTGCVSYALTVRNCTSPPTATPTWTPGPTITGTPPTPIVTVTSSVTPSSTPSPTPSVTLTATATASATATLTPSATPSATATATATGTPTGTPSASPTATVRRQRLYLPAVLYNAPVS